MDKFGLEKIALYKNDSSADYRDSILFNFDLIGNRMQVGDKIRVELIVDDNQVLTINEYGQKILLERKLKNLKTIKYSIDEEMKKITCNAIDKLFEELYDNMPNFDKKVVEKYDVRKTEKNLAIYKVFSLQKIKDECLGPEN